MTDPETDRLGCIVDILSGMFPDGASLHDPIFQGTEWKYVKHCLDSGWVSTAGSYVDHFERLLEDLIGVNSVIATVSGTAALHVCLELAGVEQGDEVIVPSLTFVGTANAVSHCCAVPHFVDVNSTDLGIDAIKLDAYLREISHIDDGFCRNRFTGHVIRAVICVHVFGHSADLDPLVATCEKYNITLIEDAAESLGTNYKGIHTGSFGKLAALSFNGNKIATTGGGGAVVTNDLELGRRAKHITTTAKLQHPWHYEHDEVGYNYRMPNINAALGCAQLEALEDFISRKRALAKCYERHFSDVSGVTILNEPPNSRSNYWLNTLLLDPDLASSREEFLQRCHDIGILARAAWMPMHKLKPYRNCPRMEVPVAEDLCSRIVNLPSSASIMGSLASFD